MKIIKEGHLPPPWSKEVTCRSSNVLEPGCGTVLRVEEPDLFVTRLPSGYEMIGFQCAFCRKINLISLDFYPGDSSRLQSKRKWEETRRQTKGRGEWL